KEHQLDNLMVAAPTPFGEHTNAMAVRKDWPALVSLIDKGLADMTPEERSAITRKWGTVEFKPQIDYRLAGWVMAGAVLIFLVFFFWNRRLQQEVVVRKRTEEALNLAMETAEAANRAKSIFLANMSHELRTPLNAILGFSQSMQRDPVLTADQIDKLDIINKSGSHLLDLINDVLEISKIEAGRAALSTLDLNLHELLRTLESMFAVRAEEKGLTLQFEISSECPCFVNIDPQKLRQILLNLLSNAVKFTEKGRVILRVAYSDGRLMIEVEDAGAGMTPEEARQIFEPFYQGEAGRRSHEGTGLGLAISHRFVEIMGGNMRCNSAPGKGSVFSFKVPAPAVENSEAAFSVAERRVIGLEPGQPYRILVVEDHLHGRKLLAQLLQSAGFEVKTAGNGEEAVHIRISWRPDLIWMDIAMPVMDGLEATRRIKAGENGPKTIIIALTAHAFENEREKILAAGCDDFVRKPFKEHEIFEAMCKHLGVKYISDISKGLFRRVRPKVCALKFNEPSFNSIL
ncbi:MAG: response regulator, partial [Deltaproteobacteria bacterium]|nr:response regulator [Deltaproteobacteria bacterium]